MNIIKYNNSYFINNYENGYICIVNNDNYKELKDYNYNEFNINNIKEIKTEQEQQEILQQNSLYNSFIFKQILKKIEKNEQKIKLIKNEVGLIFNKDYKKFKDLNWRDFSINYQLSEQFIETFFEYLKNYMDNISKYQKLSNLFIKKYIEYLNIQYISYKQQLSEKIIKDYIGKFLPYLKNIFKYQTLSLKTRSELKNYLNNNNTNYTIETFHNIGRENSIIIIDNNNNITINIFDIELKGKEGNLIEFLKKYFDNFIEIDEYIKIIKNLEKKNKIIYV